MKWIKGISGWWYIIPVVAVVLFFAFLMARYPMDRDSLKVYYQSGPNVFEILKTFDHFRHDQDFRKYEATKFLVRNMDQHYYIENIFSDKKIEWYSKHFDRVHTKLNETEDSLKTVWEDLRSSAKSKKIRDARGISTEFLIKHINQAFENWDRSRWSRHLTFDQFCEFMLPYKPWECKPELWLEYYNKKYGNILSSLPDSTSILERIYILKDTADKTSQYFPIGMNRKMTPVEMQLIRCGDCYYHSAWNNLIYQSQGFPTAELQIVNPANARYGHHWNALLKEDGSWKEFMSRGDSILIWPIVPAKIYVKHWGKQERSFRALAKKEDLKEKDIPEGLSSWLLVDVTKDVIPTTDVKIDLTSLPPSRSPFVYLSVYDDGVWHPVHWAYYEDKTALFSEMEKNAMYLPVFYQNGQSFRAGPLFILRYTGEIEYPAADTNRKVPWLLDRVYPIKYYLMNRHASYMVGAVLEGSNDPSLLRSDTLLLIEKQVIPPRNEDPEHKFIETYDQWWGEIVFEAPKSFSYLRYRSAPEKPCYIGDLELYNIAGEKIQPVAFSGPGRFPETICDGIYGEDYLHDEHGSSVVMDLGSPVSLSKVKYIPHDIDPASVQTGDEYVLSIWDGTDWKPLLHKKAMNKTIPCTLYPGGIYLLENQSRFVHSRPFRYLLRKTS